MTALLHTALFLAHLLATPPAACSGCADGSYTAVIAVHSDSSVRVVRVLPGADKLQHFWASYAVTSFGFAAARAAGADSRDALVAGVAASAVAGIAKELIDARGGGPFSMRDLLADALGTAAAWFLLREVR